MFLAWALFIKHMPFSDHLSQVLNIFQVHLLHNKKEKALKKIIENCLVVSVEQCRAVLTKFCK